MKASRRARSAGFTLTELMLGIVVLGILTAAGMPSFTKMIRNQEIRGAAEAVANGIGRARAEAVSRNAKVQFVLSLDASWWVDYVSNPDPNNRLDSRPATDSPRALATVVPVGATTITFNQLGQVAPNAPVALPPPTLAEVTFTATGGDQTLKVKIYAGGNARVCDDTLPVTNFRSCLYNP